MTAQLFQSNQWPPPDSSLMQINITLCLLIIIIDGTFHQHRKCDRAAAPPPPADGCINFCNTEFTYSVQFNKNEIPSPTQNAKLFPLESCSIKVAAHNLTQCNYLRGHPRIRQRTTTALENVAERVKSVIFIAGQEHLTLHIS